MQFYYLDDNTLHGPVSIEALSTLHNAGTIHDSTPIWNPLQEKWNSCGAITSVGHSTTLLPPAKGGGAKNAAMRVPPKIEEELPEPAFCLVLRLAEEKGWIAPDQRKRLMAQAAEDRERFRDGPIVLERDGYIDRDQRESLEEAVNIARPPKSIGGYEIMEELGRGGMGITYMARQVAMDRIVALKVLKSQYSQDDEFIGRFRREAQMAARLNHENIATAYEVGEAHGQYFLSMEYVEGRTVADILDEREHLPEDEATELIMQVCRALAHAHENDIIHRDVSSKNIILKPDGRVKVIDMGLAKTVSSGSTDLTTAGFVIGTPAYMSPERALGEENVDIRSDIYSLGCVFYEILTGEAPLVGESKFETINLHINNPVPSVKEICPSASDLVCHVIARMTAMQPEDRYQNPQEVLEGFSANDETVQSVLGNVENVPSISRQLQSWDGTEAIDIRVRSDWREYVHLIAQNLDEVLETASVDPEFQGFSQTIFAELVANAFDHGCKDVEEGLILIRLEINSAFFRLEVEDPGPGFEARKMLERIKSEPLDRERRRGIMQIANIADVLEYSPSGNRVKAVLYRKSEGSGIVSSESGDITYVEIKGKGDLALAEAFRKWVEDYDASVPARICLMIRTEWVSSMFVGTIGKLQSKLSESGSALSVWAEHRSCFRILQQLGVSSFVRIYDSLEMAQLALRYENVESREKKNGAQENGKSNADEDEESKKDASKHTTDALKKAGRAAKNSGKAGRRRQASNRRIRSRQKRKGLFGWLGDLLR